MGPVGAPGVRATGDSGTSEDAAVQGRHRRAAGHGGDSPSLCWGGRRLSGGAPAVAVSLTGPTVAEARRQASRAAQEGADVVEMRVDLMTDVLEALPGAPAAERAVDLLQQVTEAVGGVPVLLTCRTAAEGGSADLDDSAYASFLRAVLELLAGRPRELRPAALDVELQRGCLAGAVRAAHELGIDVVASFHDFQATPSDAVLEGVLADMADQGADLAKIAVQPVSAEDVARLLGVSARAAAGLDVVVAAMSMGALGAVSRVAPVFGSALTFTVVPDEEGRVRASAPGQLPIREVRRCLALLGQQPVDVR